MGTKSILFHDISVRIAKLINLLLMTVPFAVAWYTCYADKLWVTFAMRGHWLVILLFALLYFIIGRIYDAFKISYNKRREMVYSQMLSLIETDVVMYIVAWLLIRYLPPVLPMVLVLAAQSLCAVLWSVISRKWYFHTFPADKTVVVYDMREGLARLIDEYDLKKKFKVVANTTSEACVEDLSLLDGADTVFLAGIHSHQRNIIVKYCVMNGIRVFLVPRVGDLIISGARRTHMFHILLLNVGRFRPPLEYLVIKRAGDIALSLLAIVLLSPLMVITAVCIKVEDGGSVIYRQCRLTKDGRKFDIFKFRSMQADAESDGVARLSTGEEDDRVTKTGRVIRKYRIDELPQLFNILKGEMSIVGPRAERPEIAAEYQKELPEFEMRLHVKAGLTGSAQVYGKYNTTPYDKLLMDLMYIANATVFEDIRIMFATVKALSMPESTEGVAEGATTAMDAVEGEQEEP